VNHDFGVVHGARQPEIRLNLSHGKAASVEPVEERLNVLSGNH
jgi:hypothetical protein